MTQRFIGGYTMEFEGGWSNFTIREALDQQDYTVRAYEVEHKDGSRSTYGVSSLNGIKGLRDFLTGIIDAEENHSAVGVQAEEA